MILLIPHVSHMGNGKTNLKLIIHFKDASFEAFLP